MNFAQALSPTPPPLEVGSTHRSAACSVWLLEKIALTRNIGSEKPI